VERREELTLAQRRRGAAGGSGICGRVVMELDTKRIDAAVLALLLPGLHDGCRVWKSFDWDAK
jgi:hypothetical protein